MAEQQNFDDQDAGKGAVEGEGGNTSMAGQNPHRVRTRMVKDNDSDFPEPGGSPEHSGQEFTVDQHGRPHQETGVVRRGSTLSHEEPGTMNESTRKALRTSERDSERRQPDNSEAEARRSPERETVDQDPGERQKENQNQSKDDPLAA